MRSRAETTSCSRIRAGNKLNHEIETFNPATGQLIAWVQVPSVSPTTDTVIYMYYGNPSAGNQQNKHRCGTANYRGVWHLPHGNRIERHGFHLQWQQRNDRQCAAGGGRDRGAASSTAECVARSGQRFGTGITGPITAEAWINVTDWPANGYPAGLLGMGYSYASGRTGLDAGGRHRQRREPLLELDEQQRSPARRSQPRTTLATGTWHHLGGHLRRSHLEAVPGWSGEGPAPMQLGSGQLPVTTWLPAVCPPTDSGPSFGFNGLLDELRVSNTARTSGWIATEYNNQSSPGNFLQRGPAADWRGRTASTTVADYGDDVAFRISFRRGRDHVHRVADLPMDSRSEPYDRGDDQSASGRDGDSERV